MPLCSLGLFAQEECGTGHAWRAGAVGCRRLLCCGTAIPDCSRVLHRERCQRDCAAIRCRRVRHWRHRGRRRHLGSGTGDSDHREIARSRRGRAGDLLGSNIFNGLFIVAVAAIIHPISIGWRGVFGALTCGVAALLCSYPSGTGFIERRRGFLLLVLYVVYLTTVLQMAAT